MEQSSLSGTAEQIIAVLDSKNAKGAECTLTSKYLYIDGTAYFVTHHGAWKKAHEKYSADLKNVTHVSYLRRSNPSKAVARFLFKVPLSIILMFLIVSILESMYSAVPEDMVLQGIIAPPLLANILVAFTARRESMLGISVGSETIYLKTSWYMKEAIDNFHNQMIKLVDEIHGKEQLNLDMDTGETYGGKPIIAEFGEQYRRQYMKDKRTKGGFCILTHDQVLSGGLHKVQLMPGAWAPSRAEHGIGANQISSIFFRDHISAFKALLLDIALTGILAGAMYGYVLLGLPERNVVSIFGLTVCQIVFWGFPDLAGIKMRREMLVIEGASGTYGFDTQWYTKEEVNHFQKIIIKIIEMNAKEADKNQQVQHAETPAVYRQFPAALQQSAPMQATPEVSIKEGAALLREYNQLLRDGIIDQTEFEQVKAEILSKREYK